MLQSVNQLLRSDTVMLTNIDQPLMKNSTRSNVGNRNSHESFHDRSQPDFVTNEQVGFWVADGDGKRQERIPGSMAHPSTYQPGLSCSQAEPLSSGTLSSNMSLANERREHADPLVPKWLRDVESGVPIRVLMIPSSYHLLQSETWPLWVILTGELAQA